MFPTCIARISAILMLCACLAPAQEKRRFQKKWIASVAALAAVNFFDAYTSRNMGESNPLLRGSNGSFSSSRGAALKFGATGGFLAVQYLMLRKAQNPDLSRSFTITNGILAGVVSGVAIRNYSIRNQNKPNATPPTPAYLTAEPH